MRATRPTSPSLVANRGAGYPHPALTRHPLPVGEGKLQEISLRSFEDGDTILVLLSHRSDATVMWETKMRQGSVAEYENHFDHHR
jgi:hypothetical protein